MAGANRLFVTIDPIDDIESLLKFGTEDNLMIGRLQQHRHLRQPERAGRGPQLGG